MKDVKEVTRFYGAISAKFLVVLRIYCVVLHGWWYSICGLIRCAGCGKGLSDDVASMRSSMIIDPRRTIKLWCLMFSRVVDDYNWTFLVFETCFFMTREKYLTRYRDHCTYVMRWSRRITAVYCVSLSQYDWMMRMRCLAVEHVSWVWNRNV